ncbi:POK8 protein, partial [Oceanites oceanicus]|nr:POK8 protein [Oceanites oceanicus]
PYLYLGWKIDKTTITPQKVQLKPEIRTLNDVQKLVGDLNWLQTLCGIANEDMAPLV